MHYGVPIRFSRFMPRIAITAAKITKRAMVINGILLLSRALFSSDGALFPETCENELSEAFRVAAGSSAFPVILSSAVLFSLSSIACELTFS